MILRTSIVSPLGTLIACTTDLGVCLLAFDDSHDSTIQSDQLQKHFNAPVLEGEHPHLFALQLQLQEYFAGQRVSFSIPLHITGTNFQQKVWEALIAIPYGTTRSYKQQSLELKKPEAIRAVANANGRNKIAILIPCHRIIGENGDLTGYAGGLWRKKWLLDMEMKSQMKLNF